jgi:hypothetical protein
VDKREKKKKKKKKKHPGALAILRNSKPARMPTGVKFVANKARVDAADDGSDAKFELVRREFSVRA